jgi:7,8-dihydropterin-6-yl-methyl-4-(beta-D-ribofuranosyl)aminobenzene 5'-phosphate synthase
MRITILVDNYVAKRNFLAEHGFSLLIETKDRKILFDTGQGYVLENNLHILGKDISDISQIVLSHGHDDHTGGLKFFIKKGVFPSILAHPDIVYPKFKIEGDKKSNIGLKNSLDHFQLDFSKDVKDFGNGIIFSGEVPKNNKWELEETKYFRSVSGRLEKDPFSDDTSLFVKTPRGLLVLTGCAHSGIINIVQYGLNLTKAERLYGIIGGMHLKSASLARIKRTASILSEMKPDFLTISHCTGFDAGVIFKNIFKERAIFTSVGMVFNI